MMRHSAAHVMAQAVMRLFEGVQLAFGPTTGNGFYYDFELAAPALRGRLPDDRSRDAEDRQGRRAVRAARRAARRGARARAASWARSSRSSTSRRAWPTKRRLSFYRQGEFIDLCRGPHIPSTGHIGSVQAALASPARTGRATPRASSCSGSTRTAFFDKKELDAHLDAARRGQAPRPPRARQAARAVHHQPDRRLGPDPVAAQGGDHPRRRSKTIIKDELRKRGYQPVYTPNIGRVELYQISGHFPYYSDSQFPPIEMSRTASGTCSSR